LLLGIPAFAIANAITEEAVFRGALLLTALMESSRRPWLASIVQAASIAAAHYEIGFPNGPAGYWMVFGYALLLGLLRLRTVGLMAPIAAHIVVDLVIGYIVIARRRI
jgi:uncharacterized protein